MLPIALRRYLQHYLEPQLPQPPADTQSWAHSLVVPLYRESPTLLRHWQRLGEHHARVLVIAVLNRPANDNDSAVNNAMRRAIGELPARPGAGQNDPIRRLSPTADLLLYDHEKLRGTTPRNQGVGLARKAGCDIALQWITEGRIASPWICSSDADAVLPDDYFQRLPEAGGRLNDDAPVAVTYPFQHLPGGDAGVDRGTALYELRLHHYVLGLEYARSRYAYHTLGSCLGVDALAYAQVRGFPRRSAAEDFYLLNKVAKLGPVLRLGGACIALRARASTRVPFGTGPATMRIAGQAPETATLFYHPQSFAALRALLDSIPACRDIETDTLATHLRRRGLEQSVSSAAARVMQGLGWSAALAHCRRHGRSDAQFLRQFHQWFDGFRTLKFIHGLRAAGWEDQSLASLASVGPELWPTPANGAGDLLQSVQQQWRWAPPPSHLFTDPRRCDPAGW
jgi:hypothetical protein